MIIPRQARRRLNLYTTLPSGWFAVWFCSLLGFCHVLFPLPSELPDSGIQWPTQFGNSYNSGTLLLFVAPLHPSAAERKRWKLPYKTAAQLATLLQWQHVSFTGAPITDFIAFANTIQAVKTIQADTSHKSGVRILFKPHATFGSLVATLDMLNKLDQKRYWVSSSGGALILYVITIKSTWVSRPLSFL